jgi:glycogen operon protein
MVCDSLRYWHQEMHVDGFRFDLGTILAREPGGFDTHNGFMKTVMQDPVLAHVKVIAEPWDCGPGGYQVGGFPPGWAEWNDKFRDAVRDFWRGAAPAGAVSPVLCASAATFNHRGRKPWASVNFVTAHDGFPVRDLVTYAEKHNEANGDGNTDGNDDNRSSNYGVEGPSDDPAIVALRQRQVRNLLTTLLFAQGTPMVLAGDEFGRTQRGSNNAYCQDNETSWVDWESAGREAPLTEFVRRLVALRREMPLLRQRRFLNGEILNGSDKKDVTWLLPSGSEITQDEWCEDQLRCFGMLLYGEPGECLLVMNASEEDVPWTLPALDDGRRAWFACLDTSQPTVAEPTIWLEPVLTVKNRSFVLLQARTSEGSAA